jgi:selenocysteine lyase/cysteine desulfurase
MERVERHVHRLTELLLAELLRLRHTDGRPLIVVHGPATTERRGGTVAFSVLDATGTAWPFDQVVQRAAAFRVSLRGGCFCNPGCAEAAFAFPPERARACRESLGTDFTIAGLERCLGRPVGAVRASVGVPTVPADLGRLVEALASFRGARVAEPAA